MRPWATLTAAVRRLALSLALLSPLAACDTLPLPVPGSQSELNADALMRGVDQADASLRLRYRMAPESSGLPRP